MNSNKKRRGKKEEKEEETFCGEKIKPPVHGLLPRNRHTAASGLPDLHNPLRLSLSMTV